MRFGSPKLLAVFGVVLTTALTACSPKSRPGGPIFDDSSHQRSFSELTPSATQPVPVQLTQSAPAGE